jgi:NADH-quinone oxidoreductase subunit L
MVMGMGVGAFDAALLHLVTHAFFKAALFLNAGIVIHAIHQAAHQFADEHSDVQDIRNMGGLRKILPVTFYTYLPAAAALVGIPLFSGFLSKDAILVGTWTWASLKSSNGNLFFYLIPVFGFGSVFLTGYYMARHGFYIFMGKPRLYREPELYRKSKTTEASKLLLLPVIILSVLSLAFFFSLNPLNHHTSWLLPGLSWPTLLPKEAGLAGNLLARLDSTLTSGAYITLLTAFISVLLAVLGIAFGWRVYTRDRKKSLTPETAVPATGLAKLALNHFYLDNFYEQVFIRPFMRLSGGAAAFDRNFIDYGLNTFGKAIVILAKIIGWVDRKVVDGVVNLTVWLAGLVGKTGRLLQNGKIQSYYIFSLLGLILLVLYILAW